MTRALITGGSGFLGSYMAERLTRDGVEVFATYFREPAHGRANGHQGVRSVHMDINSRPDVARVVEMTRPDVVYHFAGQAYVQPSWEDPVGTFGTNFAGTIHLLEELRRHRPRTPLAFAGSGTEYGEPDQVPTPEQAALRPTSPYAASKAAADLACYQYHQSFELPVFRYRIFGTTGVGKRGDVCNDFASQVAAREHDAAPHLKVGDLSKQRDIADVRDAVDAMVRVVERGTPGEAYNIGGGAARDVREILDTLIRLSGAHFTVETEASRLRRVDEPVHLADVSRLTSLGWRPSIPFDRTLQDILDSWRGADGSAATARSPT